MTVARTPVTFVEALTLASTKNMVTVMFLSWLILTLPFITPWVVKRSLTSRSAA
ncbi:hypothetical protein [Pseudomonas putida]|uniref:hypothetical protein n=1 Tax=Pseudomonas putida TaxID=303 RepID=UPI003D025F8A